jgi:hypothetical protein
MKLANEVVGKVPRAIVTTNKLTKRHIIFFSLGVLKKQHVI